MIESKRAGPVAVRAKGWLLELELGFSIQLFLRA